jgi:hypothetical protein
MKSEEVASERLADDPRKTNPFVSAAWSRPDTARFVVVALVKVALVAVREVKAAVRAESKLEKKDVDVAAVREAAVANRLVAVALPATNKDE